MTKERSKFAKRQAEVGWEQACGEKFRADWYVEALSRALVDDAWVAHHNWNQQSWDKNETIDLGEVHFIVEYLNGDQFLKIAFDGEEVEFSKGWGRYAYFNTDYDATWWEDWFHRARQEMEKHNSCVGAHSDKPRQRKDCPECRADWKRLFGNDYAETLREIARPPQ